MSTVEDILTSLPPEGAYVTQEEADKIYDKIMPMYLPLSVEQLQQQFHDDGHPTAREAFDKYIFGAMDVLTELAVVVDFQTKLDYQKFLLALGFVSQQIQKLHYAVDPEGATEWANGDDA